MVGQLVLVSRTRRLAGDRPVDADGERESLAPLPVIRDADADSTACLLLTPLRAVGLSLVAKPVGLSKM